MAEALILSLIRKMERQRAKTFCLNLCMMLPCFSDDGMHDTELTVEAETKMINELRMILEIMREKKLGEGRRLNYLICDVVEMVQVALNSGYYSSEVVYAQTWITEIKIRLLKLGVGGVETDVGEGDDGDEDLVGLEEAELLLRTWILNEERSRSILLLKGMSGIGKTVLARQVYNHSDVHGRFDRRAWVCLTHLTVKETLIKLIQQVVDSEEMERDSLLEKMERADNPSLRQMLHRYLQGMRYLIVLDDLPKRIRLQSILGGLPYEDKRSRLVFTGHTTSANVRIMDHEVYDMEFLDSNKSWKLFLQTINCGNKLKSEYKFPKELEKKGREMLTKCCGLPLAIKEVGKQLAMKRCSGSEWEELFESFDLGETLEKLDSFYHKLDEEVKPCFLHMAFYKVNTTMREEKLKQIWAAGGGEGSAHRLHSYLQDLVDESVIECKGKQTRYRVNAILHMLSIKKAEEEIGFETLRSNGNNRPSQSPRHHRVIICSRDKFNYSTDQDKHLVSLFFHGGGYFDATPSYWKSFELLKILDWEDFGLKNLPESIGTLIKLRYLGLRNNHIQELPNSLGCLKKLEVLDIAQNFMMEVPDIIWEMRSLRHLYLSHVICRKPLKIDALQNLETLTYISVDNWTYGLSGLKMLYRLCKLGIEEMDGNADVSKLFASLAQLRNLKHLILKGFRFRSMPCLDKLGILQNLHTLKLDGLLARLPDSFPSNLESLKLVNSCLEEDPMPLLEKLPRLKHLKLRNAYTGQQMVIVYGYIPRLEVMCIEELWNLRNVQVENGLALSLKRLEIKNCPNLETLPESIRYVGGLKMVTTKIIATKIRMSGISSNMRVVDINP